MINLYTKNKNAIYKHVSNIRNSKQLTFWHVSKKLVCSHLLIYSYKNASQKRKSFLVLALTRGQNLVGVTSRQSLLPKTNANASPENSIHTFHENAAQHACIMPSLSLRRQNTISSLGDNHFSEHLRNHPSKSQNFPASIPLFL